MNARSPRAPGDRRQRAPAGFTLFEVVLVLVLMSVMSIYVAPKSFNTSALTLDAQARNLVGHLQRAQLLATATGNAVYFCSNSTTYLIQVGPSTCPSLPATLNSSRPIQVTLEKNATLSVNNALVYDSLGQPNAATNLVLNASPAGSKTITVNVAAVTGYVTR